MQWNILRLHGLECADFPHAESLVTRHTYADACLLGQSTQLSCCSLLCLMLHGLLLHKGRPDGQACLFADLSSCSMTQTA